MPGLTGALREHGRSLGFSLVGVTTPDPSSHLPFYRDWIGRDLHGDMEYLAREDAVERRGDLSRTMEGVRSVVVVGHEYHHEDDPDVLKDPSRGIIARYARGADYHRVVKKKLRALARWIEERVGDGLEARAYVDTGPILERDLARRAGLGWFGRNTMLIHPRRGSYFFLGVLLLNIDLDADAPFEADRCGSCRACLDACPTGALLGRDEDGAPVIDARRCISYLTIEHRGPIREELRPLMGKRVYGCDICQEVCPFNLRFAEEATEPRYAARGPGEWPVGVEALPGERTEPGYAARGAEELPTAVEPGEAKSAAEVEMAAAEVESAGEVETAAVASSGARGDVSAETRPHPPAATASVGDAAHPGTSAPSLVDLMRMTREEWDAFSRGSAIRRAGYVGFKRNVAVAMGNWLASVDEPPQEAVAALREGLREEAMVREHATWALEQLGSG